MIWDLFCGQEYLDYFHGCRIEARKLEEFSSYGFGSMIIFARKK